jgi:ABC-type sugar transport system permease subunit
MLVAYPLFNSFMFSFYSTRVTPAGMIFSPVGLGNFRDLFLAGGMNFLQTLIDYFFHVTLQTVVIASFSLIIAMLLGGNIRMKGLFRTIFFLPVIIATGPVMNELSTQGVASIPMVNQAAIQDAIYSFMPQGLYMLADAVIDVFASLIMILWYSGVQILIFLAGLQKVDPTLYEAAEVDGGSGWECFWKITIPILRPMVLLNVVYTIVSLSTGGQNQIIGLIYDNMFSTTRGYGFASAMAWSYALIILLMLGIAWLLLRERKDKTKYARKVLARGYR